MRDDFASAVRALRGSRGIVIAVLAILSLAIGAAVAIFSVVDAVLLRSLPFDEHDRIVAVLELDPKQPTPVGGGTTTPQMYLDWRRHQQSFAALAGTISATLWLKAPSGEPVLMRTERVTPEWFSVLRTQPLIGRPFGADDEVDGRHRVAILSFGLWQERFGGDPGVLGRTIELDEQSWQIVGVMPQGFAYPPAAQYPTALYVPLAFKPADTTRAGNRNYGLLAIGRLKDDVTLSQASDEMNRLAAALDAQHPTWAPGRRVQTLRLHDHLVGRMRSWMLLLLGAVGLVLLIACVNVANLLLARATVRSQDIAIRAALGANRWQLARMLFAEALILSLTATSLGVALAFLLVRMLRAWLPPDIPRVAAITIDLRILGIAITAGVVTALLFGLVPALSGSRAVLAGGLREKSRTATGTAAGHRVRNALVVMQIALGLILLVGAGLFIGSFARLVRIDPGFDYSNVLALNVGVRAQPGKRDEAIAQSQTYFRQMLEAVKAVPGVQEAAAVNGGLPLSGSWSRSRIELPGRSDLTGEDATLDRRTITPDYLSVLRVPLLRGRHVTDRDLATTEPVIVVNETAARRYWPGRDPVGERLRLNKIDRLVVGVVGDIRHIGPENPPRPEGYIPLTQDDPLGVTLVMRTSRPPLETLPDVRAAIWSVNPNQRLFQDVVTLEAYMDRLIAQRRFSMALLTLFGLVGLAIAAIGLNGVMSYAVAQRRQEIGLRLALGATPAGVRAMVMGRAAVLMAIGLAIGGIGLWMLGATVEAFLFETTPTDPWVLGLATLTLILSGLIATAFPARRAALVDPLVTLRGE